MDTIKTDAAFNALRVLSEQERDDVLLRAFGTSRKEKDTDLTIKQRDAACGAIGLPVNATLSQIHARGEALLLLAQELATGADDDGKARELLLLLDDHA